MVGIRDDQPRNPCEQPVTGSELPLDVDLGNVPGITNGHGISIAIIDTGSATPTARGDRDHCVLHGTAVASVASTIAPGSTVTTYRHSEKPEDSDGTVHTLVRAIDRAVKDHAKIINISMVACSDTAALRGAIARASKSGALVVASAGNRDQCEAGKTAYPAALPAVLSIGAVENRQQPSHQSTNNSPAEAGTADPHGTTATTKPDAGMVPADYSMPADHIDLYAPGGPVSARLRTEDGATHTIVGNPAPFQGTSFASPIVAGTAALVWQLWPSATASQIRQLLETTAVPGGADEATPHPVHVVSPARAVNTALELTSAAQGKATAHNTNSNEFAAPGIPSAVSAHPPTPATADYRVAIGLSIVLALAVIAAVVARALASESKPPSGKPEINRHGTSTGFRNPNASRSAWDPTA